MKIKIKNNGAYTPGYATSSAAGCDLKAMIVTYVPPGGSAVVPTGVRIALPEGYEGQVRGRSGLNFKNGLVVPTGTIDADYRGEICVKIYNLSNKDYLIQPNERIAQLVISKVERAEWEVVETLDETDRGINGFGSSGK